MVDMNLVDMDMVDMDMVDVDMVDMDLVNRKCLVNFIYLGSLPRIILQTCLDSLVLKHLLKIGPLKIEKTSNKNWKTGIAHP